MGWVSSLSHREMADRDAICRINRLCFRGIERKEKPRDSLRHGSLRHD